MIYGWRLIGMLGLVGGIAFPAQVADAAGCLVCICSVSASSLSFGTYNPATTTPTTATATVNATCVSVSIPINATVDLALSSGTSGTASARQMANGTARLNYNIYKDAAYATVWGNNANGGTSQPMAISNLLNFNATKTAYGRIPAGQYVRTGAYSDSIIVTFTF